MQGSIGAGIPNAGVSERYQWSLEHVGNGMHITTIRERPLSDLEVIFTSKDPRDVHMERVMLLITALEA